MSSDAPPDKEERLKSALWFSIGQFVDARTQRSGRNATPQFIGALTELVWTQISSAARDMATFARHAGRTQVGTADVLLLARRNEGLEALLGGFVREREGVRERERGGRVEKTAAGRGRGRGRGAGAARGRGRGRGRGARGGGG